MCVITPCGASHVVARGMCRKHYQRWYRHGDPLAVHKTGRKPA